MTTFVEIALFTDDVPAVQAFYARLLGAEPQAAWPGGAVFEADGLKILVHDRTGALEGGPPNEDHVALGVSDLDGTCAGLETDGLELLVSPRAFPWGRSAYLRDPDGRLVELSEA